MPLLERLRVEVIFLVLAKLNTTIGSDSSAMNSPAHLADIPLAHETHVRQSIEAGLADSEAGQTVAVTVVRKKFGLPS